MPKRKLSLIDGSILSYCSIIKSTKRLDMIKQPNKLLYIIGDIEYDRLGEKEDRRKIATEAEYQRNNKSEQKKVRQNRKRLKGLETCEVMVH